MLDEPSMAWRPRWPISSREADRDPARDPALTVLLVEQRVAEALESADYGYVLEAGRIALEGPHDALPRMTACARPTWACDAATDATPAARAAPTEGDRHERQSPQPTAAHC